MDHRIVRRIAMLATFAACSWAFRPARAAVPEQPAGDAKPAAPDTSRFLPRWVHLHASAGLGWLASPEWMRKFYQAGQSYAAGFESRPGRTFRLRLDGEYQSLPGVTDAEYSFISSTSPLDGLPARDTVRVESRANGWIGSARLEAQWALAPQLWVLGGFGPGYLSTGLHTIHSSDPYGTYDLDFPGTSGWAWIATAGTSYEFELFGPRLSAELRTSYLMRDQSRFQTWSLRIGWGGH
jgi:hypothetical protein